MSPERGPEDLEDGGHELDEYGEPSPRSIFSALWFRALLAVLVLGVLAAVAVPYVLDFATTPVLKTTTAKAPLPAASPATPAAAPAASPAEPTRSEAPSAAVVEATPAKPATTKPAIVAKIVEAPKPVTKTPESAKPGAVKAASGGAAGGPYWVQVGAFKDAETAKRLAARLREQGFRVDESTTAASASRPAPPQPAPSSPNRYDVVVSGASAADVDAKLAPKGLTAESTANGIVVRPSLTLRDAVALSRDLADAGLSVQVRRIGGPAPAPPSAAPSAGGQTLHRVRVGGFPDRAAAVAAMKRLEDKGFAPFIARGNP